MRCRRLLPTAALCAAVPILFAGCGNGDAGPGDAPPVPDLTTPTSLTTPATSTTGGSSPVGPEHLFCRTYPRLEATFETVTGETIEETRANLAAIVDEAEQTSAPVELAADWAVLTDGFREIAGMADRAVDNEGLQAAIAGFDASSFDASGRVVEEWSEANC